MGEETGLYYYGARYYNPRESVWLSTDPLSGYNPMMEFEHYIDGEHNGGVYNSFNHNTYGYCYQNPVLYVDPNGKQSEFFKNKWDKIKQGFSNKKSQIANDLSNKKLQLANDLVKKHQANEDKIMAYSIAMDVLIETTEYGEWVTKAREKIVNTYGDNDMKKANEVYSKVISTLKDVKEAIEGNINSEDKSKKMVLDKSDKKQKKLDRYIYITVAKLGVKTIGLQVENKTIEETVKKLDKKTYDNKLDNKPKDSTFGGAGSSGKYQN
ncbi:RHS repeat-associated core domain-containing protein [Apibacter raozihei]|uniref:RHS repeat domain-containing protein n=1 Tax=Apibacter raozihei TaxID=2500547 RepID=UPI0015F2E1D3